MRRRFEFVGGSSAKFWEVNVVCCDVFIRFGRLGTDGQTQTKPHADAKSAREYAEKLVEQKLGKGYREVAVV